MPKPVMITCAPTGGIHAPTMPPHLPITPAGIATASIETAEAGASPVWTRDLSTTMKLSARLRYGMPWAAMKGSGTGSDMSAYALDPYTAIRHVLVAH